MPLYCPTCATQAADGAKFCKTCGLNLNAVTQALNGGVVVSDPARDREYKRARKQISEGIHGSAIGAALLVVAGGGFFLALNQSWVYVLSLLFALGGIVKLFRSIGTIVDAKMGPKLLDPSLQQRTTGSLTGSLPSLQNGMPRVSQRLSPEMVRTGGPVPHTRQISLDQRPDSSSPAPPLGTGRINREHSSPLRQMDREDDLLSKLRN